MTICVGLVLRGFCNGYFGHNSYEDKRIEAFGADWIVARAVDPYAQGPQFAEFKDQEEMQGCVEKWVVEESEVDEESSHAGQRASQGKGKLPTRVMPADKVKPIQRRS